LDKVLKPEVESEDQELPPPRVIASAVFQRLEEKRTCYAYVRTDPGTATHPMIVHGQGAETLYFLKSLVDQPGIEGKRLLVTVTVIDE
jgi:hypothetical protein